MKIPEGKTVKKVGFSIPAPQAEKVSIAGDFNGWDPVSHPLKRDKKRVWKISLSLYPKTYQYRFFMDGEWQDDPNCADRVANSFGTFNCLKELD